MIPIIKPTPLAAPYFFIPLNEEDYNKIERLITILTDSPFDSYSNAVNILLDIIEEMPVSIYTEVLKKRGYTKVSVKK